MKSSFDTRRLTILGILTAIVVVLQLIGNYFAVPIGAVSVSISLSLIPIVIASTMRGPMAGGWLGFVSAMVILLFNGATFFLGINAFGTVVTVLIKGIASGLCAGIVYAAVSKIWGKYVGVIAAAIICPVVNTGLFFIGGLIFFYDILPLVFIGALVNFSFELVVNLVFSTSIVRIIEAVEKK